MFEAHFHPAIHVIPVSSFDFEQESLELFERLRRHAVAPLAQQPWQELQGEWHDPAHLRWERLAA